MSQTDKHKLAAWKDLLDRRERSSLPGSAARNWPRCSARRKRTSARRRWAALGSDVLTTKVTDRLDGATSIRPSQRSRPSCNANPVIFMKYPGNYVFKGLGINTGVALPLSPPRQRGHAGQLSAERRRDAAEGRRVLREKFANLVGMLDSIPEGDGDGPRQHRRCLVQRNVGRQRAQPQQRSDRSGWQRRRLLQDRLVDQRRPTPGATELTNGNSMSQCTNDTGQANGTTQATGTLRRSANAPINKYFYNLMNAMGVKAGADGFPEKGGPQR